MKFDELAAKDPRSNEDEKAYQKLLKGQQFTTAVLEILQAHTSDEAFLEFDKFQKHLEKLIGSVEGMSDSRLKNIAYELSEMDKEAVIQKNRKKQIIIDPTTKDTEIIKLNQDVDTYMQQEVLPHIPDALYFYEFDETKQSVITTKSNSVRNSPLLDTSTSTKHHKVRTAYSNNSKT